MVKPKITFLHMDHSGPLEEHTQHRMKKLMDHLKGEMDHSPFHVEVWLKANAQHPHHAAEISVKTNNFDLHAKDAGPDMYVAIDNVLDKMVSLVNKDKEKRKDKGKRAINDKRAFVDDLIKK